MLNRLPFLSRRKLLTVIGVLAAYPLLPVSEALTGINNPGGASSAGTVFNGGTVQVNTNTFGFAGMPETVNVFKTGQGWTYISGGAHPNPGDGFDSDGYPTAIVNGGVINFFYVPTQQQKPGTYKITWDGSGTVALSNAVLATGGLSTSGCTVTPSGIFWGVGISVVGSPHITNLKVYNVNDQPLIDRGQIWGDKFLARLREANFGVIRFLNWQGLQAANFSNVTTWATRRPATSAYWAGGTEIRQSLYVGTTTNSGDNYTTVSNLGAPTDRQTIILQWNATSTTSTVTLSTDGGSTFYPVLDRDSRAFVSSNRRPVISLFSTMVFDSFLGGWLKRGGDISAGSQYLDNGVPYEMMLDLCNQVGAHPYFCLPPLASDPVTDFSSSLATLCKNYAASNAPWMVPRFEGPNEEWNSQFDVFWYGNNRQTIRNGGAANSSISYTITAFSSTGTGSTGTSTLTLNNPFTGQLGGLLFTTMTGAFGMNGGNWTVIALNVGGNPNVVTINQAPTGGSFASGSVLPQTSDTHNWYGTAVSNLGQQVNAVYGGTVATQTKYQVICGVATVTTPSSSNNRLVSLYYVTNSGIAGNAAKNWVTHICCAQYIAPSDYGTGAETTLAAAYQGVAFTGSISGTTLATSGVTAGPIAIGMTIQGVGINGAAVLPATTITAGSGTSWTVNNSQTIPGIFMQGGLDLTAPQTYLDTINSGVGIATLSAAAANYSAWAVWAGGFGINKMCGYEGGYSPDFTSLGASSVDMLRNAGAFVPSTPNSPTGLAGYTTTNLKNFVGTGSVSYPGGFTAEFPSVFELSGQVEKLGYSNNEWSVLQDGYQSPNPPQWNAIVAFH